MEPHNQHFPRQKKPNSTENHKREYQRNLLHLPNSKKSHNAREKLLRHNNRMRHRSPKNSNIQLKFDDSNLEEDHQEQMPILEYLLNKQFQDENLPPNSHIIKKYTPIPNFHLDLSSNIKEIFEESPEIIEPSAAFEKFVIESEFPSSTNNILGELRYPFGKNFLYQLRKSPKNPIKALLPNEPHMKLSILRAGSPNFTESEYYVTPRGMINSGRNTDHPDIIIGRQEITPEGVIPNDICLHNTDRAVSRTHCKLITQDGFKVKRDIPENFFAFLMMSHKRLGKESPGRGLYKTLYRYIFSFLKKPRKFWLMDLGSVFGTYVKLNLPLSSALERGQTYLIGLDTFFNILEVNNGLTIHKDRMEEDKEMDEESEFLKFLLQEKIYNKCAIHGLSRKEEEALNVMLSNHNTAWFEDHSISNNDTVFLEPPFKRPYVKVEIQSFRGIHSNLNHIFIANPSTEFTLGRMQGAHVNLNVHTISRRQCRFAYEEGVWKIYDGSNNKESTNGTWVSLTDFRIKNERQESEPREIFHGTEIKISDTIIKVEIFNNDDDSKSKIIDEMTCEP